MSGIYSNDAADYRYGLLILLGVVLPGLALVFVEQVGIGSTLLGLLPIALISVVVILLKVRGHGSKGAKAIKTIIASMYVILLVVMLPTIGALAVREREVLAGAVYVTYLIITLVTWILVDTQILDRRVAAWRETSPTPRTRGAWLPAPGVDGNSSEAQAMAHDSEEADADVGDSEEIDDE